MVADYNDMYKKVRTKITEISPNITTIKLYSLWCELIHVSFQLFQLM